MTRIPKSVFFVFVLLISLLAVPEVLAGTGAAERAGTIQHSLNMLDTTILNSAKAFEFTVWKYVNALFWTLAGISLAWTAIEMALKQAEFGEIVAELCKFIVTTGFFFGKPTHEAQIYDNNTYNIGYTYLGITGKLNSEGYFEIEQRNKFSVGETIEIMKPNGDNIEVEVLGIKDETGADMESCPHPKQKLFIKLSVTPDEFDLLRRKEA